MHLKISLYDDFRGRGGVSPSVFCFFFVCLVFAVLFVLKPWHKIHDFLHMPHAKYMYYTVESKCSEIFMVNYIKTSPLILGPFYSSRESTSLVPYSFYNKTSSNINIRVTNNYNHNSIQDVQNINKNNAMMLTCCYVTWWDAKCSSSCFCLLLLISSAFCCANRNVFQSSCCHWNFFLKIYIKYGFMRYKNSVFNIHSSKQ